MEQIVFLLQLIDSKRKHICLPYLIRKELKQYFHAVLKTVTKALVPSTYFSATIHLLGHTDRSVRKKALGVICETVKDSSTINAKLEKRGFVSGTRSLWLHLDETSLESFNNLCLEILKVVDSPDDDSSTSLKLAAVSALEILSSKFPSHDSVFSICLGSVSRRICSDNSFVSSHCLHATGALSNVLGPKALPELPGIMGCVIRKSSDVPSVSAVTKRIGDSTTGSSNSKDSLSMSILLTLEAVVDKRGGFLNPYLGDILGLVVLHPLYVSTIELKLKLKADDLRKLITDKIPVRLLLPPVLGIYSDAVKSGGSSLSIVFEMLGNLVNSMDRSSIGAYYAKIFYLCLLALDLRSQHPASVENIDTIEKNVLRAMVILTMKLTETMFRPLFIKSIEWSSSDVEDSEYTTGKTINCVISSMDWSTNLLKAIDHCLCLTSSSCLMAVFNILFMPMIQKLVWFQRRKQSFRKKAITRRREMLDSRLSCGILVLKNLLI